MIEIETDGGRPTGECTQRMTTGTMLPEGREARGRTGARAWCGGIRDGGPVGFASSASGRAGHAYPARIISRSLNFCTLPVAVRGISMNTTSVGHLNRARCRRHQSMISAAVACRPGFIST